MAIQYAVPKGTVLLCDYAMGGFREPEMVKRRPAVVISPRLPHRDGLCAVVPLSGTEPQKPVPYCVRLELPAPLPHPFPQRVWWAKCDMIATVSFERLDLFRTARDPATGKRKYLHPRLSDESFRSLAGGILHGLGLAHLTLTDPPSN